MARYVITPPSRAHRNDDLVRELAGELASPSKTQPAFIEQVLGGTHSRHVYVIWDRWADVPDDERSDAILRAYAQHEGETASNITIGIGLTSDEAIESGLLPFVVQLTKKRREGMPDTTYEKLVSEEAGQTIAGQRARQLRYPTLEAAEEAKQRLEAAEPRISWSIIEETASLSH